MTTAESTQRARRLAAVLREDERVTPLELFFDLVFVLAITQCTALMAAHPTWEGLAQGTLVLGMLLRAAAGHQTARASLIALLRPSRRITSLAQLR